MTIARTFEPVERERERESYTLVNGAKAFFVVQININRKNNGILQ